MLYHQMMNLLKWLNLLLCTFTVESELQITSVK